MEFFFVLFGQYNFFVKNITLLPDGTFYLIESGKWQKWYWKEAGKAPKCIPKKNRLYASEIAYKHFLEVQNEDLQQEVDAIDAYLEKFPKYSKSQALLEKNGYLDLISKFFQPLGPALQEWAQGPFTQNPYRPEGKVHHVLPGLAVRSKSEALIATQLLLRKIPFRYECALQIGNKIYYPDFTICHPKTGEIFYWEHLGLLDDVGYAQHAAQKLQQYAQAQIYLNRNLILTSEGSGHPLTVQDIEKSIMYIIQ